MKLANVIPIFKNGDRSLTSNYRPVALLSTVSKVFEKVVYKSIFNFLIENALMYKFQSGFLPGHSTTHQLIELVDNILQALDNKELICLIFCDVSKAFDRVWIRGLLLKLERYGIHGDILEWFRSYLTSRQQRVLLRDSVSSVGKLKAGVPQGSILGPLLFLIYINDIADDMLGICRLFADDTSIGERSYEINSLQYMVNIDLQNISSWSKQWLVKLNPNKTEIVVFSTRDTPEGLAFSLDDTEISPVACHKHLGVTLSSNCKWTLHIDTVVEKVSKQIAVLRKLKYTLSRQFLEKIYLTFIRPLLEYSCELWDSCSKTDSDRLEKLQLEAARIVTGLTMYANISSIYDECGWEKLSVRREQRKLSLFYKIVNGDAPEYLSDILPNTVDQTNNYNLRTGRNFTLPSARLSIYQSSYFPSTIRLWNSLDSNIRESPNSNIFKYRLKSKYPLPKKSPIYYTVGDRKANILHTRLRHRCSGLRGDLFRCNLLNISHCECGHETESVEHYLLHCNLYRVQRIRLFNNILALGIEPTIKNMLYGKNSLDFDLNCTLFKCVQRYIIDTKRFVYN